MRLISVVEVLQRLVRQPLTLEDKIMNALGFPTPETAKSTAQDSVLQKLSANWLAQQKSPPPLATSVRVRPRVAVYLRYSTDQQDPYSFERQLNKARDYATSIGGDIVKVYGDPGQSGAFTANRPEFREMLSAARRREFDVLLIEDGDRLSRRLHITARAFAELAECHIELHSSKSGKWSLMHAAFSGLMSEEHRTRISELMRSGIVKLVDRALWPGRPPYAFEKIPGSPGEMRRVPEKVEVVRRMYRQRRAGLSAEKIADLLIADGIEPPGEVPWAGWSVRHILRNPIYIGVLIYFKSSQKKVEIGDQMKWCSEKRPITEWRYSERPDWAIITVDEWNEVQSLNLLGARVFGPNAKYLLSRMVFCGACGGPMAATGNLKHRVKMKCTVNKKIKRCKAKLAPCDQQEVTLETLEETVIGLFCEKLENPEALNNMRAGYKNKVRQEEAGFNSERKKLEKERTSIRERLDATYDAALVAGLTTKVVVEQRQNFCARIEEIDRKIASIPTVEIAGYFKETPLDTALFLSELIPGRSYRDCDESLATLMATFRRLVGSVVVRTDPKTRIVSVKLTGPIADIEGTACAEFDAPSRVAAHIRETNALARGGKFAFSESDWKKICSKFPCDPIWMDGSDEPLPFRRVLEAVIFVKRTRVGPANLPDDVYGPRRHVWAAARVLNYYGVLDQIEDQMANEQLDLLQGIKLSLEFKRTKLADQARGYLDSNGRRKARVLARLAEKSNENAVT